MLALLGAGGSLWWVGSQAMLGWTKSRANLQGEKAKLSVKWLSLSPGQEQQWSPVPGFSTITPFSATFLQGHSFSPPGCAWSFTINQPLLSLHPEAKGQLNLSEKQLQKVNPLLK